jgi:hypothetical protein
MGVRKPALKPATALHPLVFPTIHRRAKRPSEIPSPIHLFLVPSVIWVGVDLIVDKGFTSKLGFMTLDYAAYARTSVN